MLPCGTFSTQYGHDMAIIRTKLQWGLLVGSIVLLYTWPLFFGSGGTFHFAMILATSIIAVTGLYMVTGLCGQINLGQAAFMAVGAYITAILMGTLGLSFWLALPCAALGAAMIGLIFGVPSLRLKGFYLAVATIAAHFVILWAASHPPLYRFTGGFQGIAVPTPTLGGIAFSSDRLWYYPVVTITLLLVFFAKNIARTRIGRAWVAIRDNDLAAEVLGINIFKYKLFAFILSSAYAGVAGALYAPFIMHVTPEAFHFMESIWFLGMLIVGGAGSIVGAIAGTVFLRGLMEIVVLYAPGLENIFPGIGTSVVGTAGAMIFGLVIILFLIFEPRGISHRWEMFKSSYRLHPFSY